jgi:hypothetical protein
MMLPIAACARIQPASFALRLDRPLSDIIGAMLRKSLGRYISGSALIAAIALAHSALLI